MSASEIVGDVMVSALREGGPGANGLVPHTLGHFLDLDEGWAALPPHEGLSPEDGLRLMEIGHGFDHSTFRRVWRKSPGSLPPRWWRGPALSDIRRIHDEGYWPRTLELVRAAGPDPGAPGARWHPSMDGPDRWRLRRGGYVVCASWERGPRVLQIATAHADVVVRDGDRPRTLKAGLDEGTLGLLSALRNTLPQGLEQDS